MRREQNQERSSGLGRKESHGEKVMGREKKIRRKFSEEEEAKELSSKRQIIKAYGENKHNPQGLHFH